MDINVKEEVITPEQARIYLDLCNTKNRPLNINRVKYYARQMEQGYWKVNGETISFDSNNTLTNGQHRLQAVIMANVPVKFLVVRNVDPRAFSTIDDVRTRTCSDVFYLNGVSNFTAISCVVRKYNILCVSNASICRGHAEASGKVKLSGLELLSIYNSHAEVFKEVTTIAHNLYKSMRLFGQAEIGAFICYLHLEKGHSMEKILKFFDMLLQHNTTESTMACDYIRNTITKSALSNKKLTGVYKQRLLIKAWNDYIEGNNAKRLIIKEGELLTFK